MKTIIDLIIQLLGVIILIAAGWTFAHVFEYDEYYDGNIFEKHEDSDIIRKYNDNDDDSFK
jgi:hypothetical protein